MGQSARKGARIMAYVEVIEGKIVLQPVEVDRKDVAAVVSELQRAVLQIEQPSVAALPDDTLTVTLNGSGYHVALNADELLRVLRVVLQLAARVEMPGLIIDRTADAQVVWRFARSGGWRPERISVQAAEALIPQLKDL